jgi:hypothetical protein
MLGEGIGGVCGADTRGCWLGCAGAGHQVLDLGIVVSAWGIQAILSQKTCKLPRYIYIYVCWMIAHVLNQETETSRVIKVG